MTKTPELLPDAWPRFERFISSIAKAGPQHRVKEKTTSLKGKGRKQKPQTKKPGR